jgi:para-nitrobenzyl esterase
MMRVLLVALVLVLASCARPPTVDVGSDRFTGKHDQESFAFLGVPYAEPPLGELRWRAPQPWSSTQGEHNATRFAPACMQTMRILDWYRYLAETFGGSRDYYPDLEISEDCLYLNVWTPTLDRGASLPVMVWIHGGSNISGWSFEPSYYGHALAQKDVVVVSVAYRLGVFGFMSHPDLDPADGLANFGLLDIVAALEWIRKYIEVFGGDPGRVTLFGESSGGHNIVLLMATDAAGHLFHRAIAQSAAGFGIRMSTLDEVQQQGIQLADALNMERDDTLSALRALPADELLDTYVKEVSDEFQYPTIDGQLLSDYPWNSFMGGRNGDVALIIGTNRDEWLDYVDEDVTADDVTRTANKLEFIDADIALEAVSGESDPRRAMDRLITADSYVCASQALARTLNEAGTDAWVYYFSRVREDEGGRHLGAYHGAEYPYVFDTHDSYMRTTATDGRLTSAIQSYWTSFATSGDPNNETAPEWTRFEAPEFAVQELGDTVRKIAAPEPEMCGTFRPDAQRASP